MSFGKIIGITLVIVLVMIIVLDALGFLYLIGISFSKDFLKPLTQTTITTKGTTTTTLPVNKTIAWLERRVYELVNVQRTAYGLSSLRWNSEISIVAREHSEDMATNGYFSHTNLQGLNISDRLKSAGIYYWNTSAENILKQSIVKYFVIDTHGNIVRTEYKSLESFAREAVESWMNSSGHRKNILGNFTETGIGVAENNNTYYFTQDFITRIDCGYLNSSCCKTPGYLPWCYKPWECINGICK